MMDCGYWVWIRAEGGTDLGAGFFITRRYIVTAAHCLTPLLDKVGARVSVELANGQFVKAEVVDIIDDDLALLDVPHREAMQTAVMVPIADIPGRDRTWWGPVRPPGNSDPHLAGVVTEAPINYALSGGRSVEAAQLLTEVEIGDFAGYSGGPVEARPTDQGPPRVIGLLVEQYLDRQIGERATNVLFAITTHHILTAFDNFGDISRPLAIRERPRVAAGNGPPSPTMTNRSGRKSAAGKLQTAFSLLVDWHESGLLEREEVLQLRLQVSARILSETIDEH